MSLFSMDRYTVLPFSLSKSKRYWAHTNVSLEKHTSTLTGQSVPYQSQRYPLSSCSKSLGVATGSQHNTHNLYANFATEAKAKAFIT